MGVFVLQLGIGVIELAGAALHPRFELEVGGMDRFSGRASRQRCIDVPRHERQQFLITGGIAHLRGIALHRQHATHRVVFEQGNAQPGVRAHRLMGNFDFTLRVQSFGLGNVDQARSALTDHILGQAPAPSPCRRAGRLPFIHVIGKSHFAGGVVEQRSIEVLREQQITDDAMQGLEQLGHVTGLAGQFGNLEQRALQMFGAFAVRHFLAQCIVECGQFQGATHHRFFQVLPVQDPVQRHGHVTGDHQKQRAVFSAVDARNVVDLHRQHAKHVIGGIFQRCAHPELGTITHAVETVLCLGRENAGGVDQQWLASGQHLPGQRQARRVQVFMVFRFQGIDVDDVDVIRVIDLASVRVIQREIEVLGVDQAGQQTVNPHQEHRTVTGRTGQIGNFIQHTLGDLRTGQGIGL
ncbi:hypothetical protein D3C78_503000 [compost metagenome]